MKFAIGQTGTIGDVDWRVMSGRKSENDMRLEIRAMEFVAPKMALGFLFSEFYAQNERALAEDGYLASFVSADAGAMYVKRIADAQRLGWEWARDQLETERRNRRVAA